MSPLQRIVREPNALVGAVTALLGVLVLFGIDLSKEQVGGIVLALGAVVVLLRQLVVPASEVLAQVKPGDATPTAGPAANVATGTDVEVTVVPYAGEHRRDVP